jgi:hypothetical protein
MSINSLSNKNAPNVVASASLQSNGATEVRKRKKWTMEMNIFIIREYFRITKLQDVVSTLKSKCEGETPVIMLISTALLLDSIIRNSVCTPAKLPCRRVEVGYVNSLLRLTFEETFFFVKIRKNLMYVCNTFGNAILCDSCDFAGSRCARPANIPLVTQNNAFPN